MDELPPRRRVAALRDLGLPVRDIPTDTSTDTPTQTDEPAGAAPDGTGLTVAEVNRILDEAVRSA